ncbi:MAG: hypothetical protein WCC94_10690 [Candidatus Bathyarchaeia archaeon]
MIDTAFIPSAAYGWEVVTKRLLLRDVARVSIAMFASRDEDLKSLKSKALVLVWSRIKPDPESNVRKALRSKALVKDLIAELINFDARMEAIEFERKVVTAMFAKFLPMPSDVFPSRDNWREYGRWLGEEAETLFPDAEPKALETAVHNITLSPAYDVQLTIVPRDVAYGQMSGTELQSLAEGKRKELKEALPELCVLRAVVRTLLAWKCDKLDKNPQYARYNLGEWLSQGVLEDTAKRLANETQIRRVLQMLNLPDREVVSPNGPRTA